jgi:hypothetical protein
VKLEAIEIIQRTHHFHLVVHDGLAIHAKEISDGVKEIGVLIIDGIACQIADRTLSTDFYLALYAIRRYFGSL